LPQLLVLEQRQQGFFLRAFEQIFAQWLGRWVRSVVWWPFLERRKDVANEKNDDIMSFHNYYLSVLIFGKNKL
jgi:hypothetical protein